MEKFNFEWIKERVQKVPGFLRDGEDKILYDFASAIHPGTSVIEIGSYFGKSTVILAAACKYNQKGVVYAIDPHCFPAGEDIKEEYNLWKEQGVHDTWEGFLKNIKECEVDDFILPMRATSEKAFELLSNVNITAGMVYIDGCHQRHFVEMDYKMWSRTLVPGGVIVFDDANQGNKDFSEGAAIVAKQYVLDNKEEYGSTGQFKGYVWGIKKHKE